MESAAYANPFRTPGLCQFSALIRACSCPDRGLKIYIMAKTFIKVAAACLVLTGAGAFAQDKVVPDNRQQVEFSYSPVVKKISPAVVNIYTKTLVTSRVSPFGNNPLFDQFFGQNFSGGLTRKHIESSLGSGVIVEPTGVIVTNAHVVKDAQEISVVLSDGREFDASVSLSDPHSDLAILRIDPKGEQLPHAPLKASEGLEVGDIVLAIGNPFGVGQTVTSGIVSALARSSLNINDFNFFIQTDAAINPGNSGGPLVAMDGGVVGINSAIYSQSGGSLGIGFAIPSEMVATVIAAEKSNAETGGKGVVRPWLGVTGQPVTADIADSLGLTRPQGVMVTKLHKSSPAKKAGMQVGDVVISINGKTIRDQSEMKFRLATVPMGQSAVISVLRKGKPIELNVEAVSPPEDPPRAEKILKGNHPLSGLKVSNINPAVAVEIGLRTDSEGVVIVDVTNSVRLSRIVRAGDLIVAINNQEIADVNALEKALSASSKQNIFAVVIERDGQRTQVIIR